jgi:hypothetical protein
VRSCAESDRRPIERLKNVGVGKRNGLAGDANRAVEIREAITDTDAQCGAARKRP